jgi:hypothetical protein
MKTSKFLSDTFKTETKGNGHARVEMLKHGHFLLAYIQFTFIIERFQINRVANTPI